MWLPKCFNASTAVNGNIGIASYGEFSKSILLTSVAFALNDELPSFLSMLIDELGC